jgi:hypothetical protein
MYRRERRISFIHIMVGAVFVLVALGFVGSAFVRCTSSGPTATTEAREFAKSMGMDVSGVTCADRDTDGDGYVSCAIGVKMKGGGIQLEAIECAAAWSLNEGCRMQRPVMRTGP